MRMIAVNLSLIFVLFLQCATSTKVTTNEDAVKVEDLVGQYRYIADSVLNPNGSYFESLTLDFDSTFLYEVRQNSFINYKTTGQWTFVSNHIVLKTDASFPGPAIRRKECDGLSIIKTYSQSGVPMNFVVLAKTDQGSDTIIYSSNSGNVQVRSQGLKDAVVQSSSGVTSPQFNINEGKCSEVIVTLPSRRVFEFERWKLKGNKIQPLNSIGQEQRYFLHQTQ